MIADPSSPGGAGFDRILLLLVPATLFMVVLFVYPFFYGLNLSFHPMEGNWLANYTKFFNINTVFLSKYMKRNNCKKYLKNIFHY